MAPLCLIFVFGIGSYLSEALSQPGKPKRKASNQQFSLPGASAMTNGSQRVMNDLAAQVNLLQSRLNDINEKGKDSLQKQKVAFEQILVHLAHENSVSKNQNDDIMREIQSLRANSSKLRGQAESLALASNKLKQDLQQLSANMTLAQEFAHQTLNKSAQMLEAPELRVLEELTKEDEASQKDKLHQSRLNDIAGEDEGKLQMLQIDTSVVETPQNLLQSLMASIDALSSQQNQSLVRMKANFDMAYQKGVELRSFLLEQQTKLNATRVYERNLQDRLYLAAEHLTKTHSELSHKLTALRTFHARLGGGNATLVYKDASSLPDSKVGAAVKSDEKKPMVALLSLTPANEVDQRAHKEQAMAGPEELSAGAIGHGHPQKNHERIKDKGKRLIHEKEVKLVKQATRARPTNATDQGLVEMGTEARIDPDAPRWLAPIKWIMR